MASTWEDWVQTYPWILAREEKHGGKRNTQCIGVRTRHCTCFSFSFYVHLTKISKKGLGDFAAAVGFYSCPSGSSVILNHLPKRATCAAYTLAQRIILLAPGKWASVSVEHWPSKQDVACIQVHKHYHLFYHLIYVTTKRRDKGKMTCEAMCYYTESAHLIFLINCVFWVVDQVSRNLGGYDHVLVWSLKK